MSDSTATTMRPRLEARRRAFLAAATSVFLKKGYANATLDDIIAHSGGSRQTLYALFGGKQGLFEALVTDRAARIFTRFQTEGQLDRAPDEVLVDLGTRYLETVTTPDALGVFRLVVAEGVVMKELAERFWEMGPGHARSLLAEYFDRQVNRGFLCMPSPVDAAQQFWGMLLGNFQLPCLLGLRDPPERKEIDTFVRTAVACFLDGCRVIPCVDGP